MRRLRAAFPIMLAVLLALATIPPAQAAVVTNTTFPITLSVFIPCANGGAGETISVSGNLHELDSVTIDSNGGLHMNDLFQPQGVSGTGLTTGAKYQAVGETRTNLNVAGATLPFTTTFVNNFDMIGQGPGNNFTVHENLHITVNADGTVISSVDNFSTTCK